MRRGTQFVRMWKQFVLIVAILIIECSGCVPDPQTEIDGIYPIEQQTFSLNGDWQFSVDPSHVGSEEEWFQPEYSPESWQVVKVPHTWNVMEEHYDYIGEAWYRLSFLPEVDMTNAQIFLNFDAVYYKAEVWLNGTYLGGHEGGYTPFRFDVSGLVNEIDENILVVKVDNYRRYNRVPDEMFDWWPYGGIVRDVSLEISSRAFIDFQLINAVPHITGWNQADSADVSTIINITNTSSEDFEGKITGNILNEQSQETALTDLPEIPVKIPAGERIQVELSATVTSPALWHFDLPNLYVWESVLSDQDGQVYYTQRDIFGIRSIELVDGQFVFNGEPVRLVGMTRHADSLEYGLAEPVSFLTADYDDMKRLNMVLSRPVHYPQDEAVLDYCDRNGILLIPEIPAWQIETTHLGNPDTLATARQQFSEMVLSSYNHPSIWAWSVGNEIDSKTPQGRDYVGGLVEMSHELDPNRPVSFASHRLFSDQDRDATALVDFVLMNEYAGSWHGPKENLPIALDQLHDLWPERAIIISEFGLEASWTTADWLGDTSSLNNDSYFYIEPGTQTYSQVVFDLRSELIRDQMDVFRSRPFVAGAIFWTYRDYRSDLGFRMGLYGRDGRSTSVIDVIQEEYSPVRSVSVSIPEHGNTMSVKVLTRGPVESDMPVYTLREYSLAWSIVLASSGEGFSSGEIGLPILAPAEEFVENIQIDVPSEDYLVRIVIYRPTGFPIGKYLFSPQGDRVE